MQRFLHYLDPRQWFQGRRSKSENPPTQSALTLISETLPPEVSDPQLDLMERLKTVGEEAAREERAFSPTQATIERLGDLAVKAVQSHYRGPLNPKAYTSDGVLVAAIANGEENRTRLAQNIERAWSDLNRARFEIPAEEKAPEPPYLIAAAATLLFTICFGSTIAAVGIYAPVEDPLLVQIYSYVTGFVPAIIATASAFQIVSYDTGSSTRKAQIESSFFGRNAGWLLLIAFGIMRLSVCSTAEDYWLAIGLIILDAAGLAYMKQEAVPYCALQRVWRTRTDNIAQTTAIAAEYERILHDEQAKQDANENELTSRYAERTKRLCLDFDKEFVSRWAVSLILHAYNMGIERNRDDRLGGAARRTS